MCQDSATNHRTNALSILARIIAKDILRKSVIGKACSEIVPHVPDEKANNAIEDESDKKGPE